MFPIIGIDASTTGTGIAVFLPPDGIHHERVRVRVKTVTSDTKDGGGADPARWQKIAGGVFSYLYGLPPSLVLMEGILLGQVTGMVIDLASVRAILAYGLHARGHRLIDHVRKPPKVVKGKKVTPPNPTGRGISPTTLKLFALGKGGGVGTNKDAMVIAAKDQFPDVDFKNNNEADALWLMEMGRYRYIRPGVQPSRPLPDHNLTALTTIDWPDW